MFFTRITVHPNQMGGVPCIRSLRIPVATVVDMAADGMTNTDILAAYPDLELADIDQALRYAVDVDLDERMARLISSLASRSPADDITDADIAFEVEAVRMKNRSAC